MNNIDLSETQLAVLSLIKSNNQITIFEMSEILRINTSAVQRNVEFLKDTEILKREGGRNGGKWMILN